MNERREPTSKLTIHTYEQSTYQWKVGLKSREKIVFIDVEKTAIDSGSELLIL